MEFENNYPSVEFEGIEPLRDLESVREPRTSFLNLAGSDELSTIANLDIALGLAGLFMEMVNNQQVESPLNLVFIVTIAIGIAVDKWGRKNPNTH